MENELIAGRYRIGRPIGRGGMGTVWLCRDEVLDRDVAIKQIGALPGEDGDGAARARREARLAASLNHPNAVSIYDVVEHDGKPWLVMEYVPAENLSEIIKERGKLPPQDIAAIAAQVAKALAAAHKAGIVHRDVKPSNILVDEFGIAKITDFGIAKGSADPQLTRTGMMAGTPAYFAPEVARGKTPAPPSDVWALGATIFHALEGYPPYGLDENTIAMLYRIGVEQPAKSSNAGILAPALGHLLDTDVDRRWSMAMAADKLGELANPRANISVSEATSARPVAPPLPYGQHPPTGSFAGSGAGAGASSYTDPRLSTHPTQATPYGAPPPTGPHPYPPTGSRPYPRTGPQSHPLTGPQSYGGTPTKPPERRKNGLLIGLVAAAAAAVIALAVILVVKNRDGNEQAAPSSDPTTSGTATTQQSEQATSSSAPATPSADQFGSTEPAPSTKPTTTTAPSPTVDPQQAVIDMQETVSTYYSLLPGDPEQAFNGYLTGNLQQNYDEYTAYWSTVYAVTCSNYVGDSATSTVSMHCVYDLATETIEQDQIATMVHKNGNFYISKMDVAKESIVTTPK